MEATIYNDGTFRSNNPGWHADDSGWKAGHIAHMPERHALARGGKLMSMRRSAGLGWKSQLMKLPRNALFGFDTDLAARWLGGYSLLVLAE